MKLAMDFERSVLHEQFSLAMAAEECNDRLAELEEQGEAHVEGRTPSDEMPFIPRRRHLAHAMSSQSADDLVLQRFAADLREEFTAENPLRVNCSCINAAASAVLKSMATNYELNLTTDYADIAGRFQIATIDGDPDERTDFIIGAESPFFLNSGGRTMSYRRMFPVNSEDQRVLTKLPRKGGPEGSHLPEVAAFQRSSAVEQLLLGRNVRKDSRPLYYRYLTDLEAIVDAMRPGDQVILWEPLVTKFKRRSDLRVSEEIFPVWISMFCHKRWRSRSRRRLKAQFVSLFIDEWNYCRQRKRGTLALLLHDHDWLRWFAMGAGLAKSN